MSLRLMSHPLPVAWDGREVRWSRWDSTDRIIICPPPKSRCECGSKRAPFVAVGMRAADTGRGRFQRRYALRDLHAVRCPDCGQVDVWDTWDCAGHPDEAYKLEPRTVTAWGIGSRRVTYLPGEVVAPDPRLCTNQERE